MIIINFSEQVDKKAIFLLFGCYCHEPKYILDNKFATTINDYPEQFHKIIWGSLYSIAKQGGIIKITPMDIENNISQFPNAKAIWINNNGWEYIESAIEVTRDKILNIDKYHDEVRKYSIIRNAKDDLKLEVSFIYDESDENILYNFQQMSAEEVLNRINDKFLNFKKLWKSASDDSYGFHISDDIEQRYVEHKSQVNTYGYPFQSHYMTTVFRGMKPKRFIIRSSVSGGGKSRNSLSDAINIACDKLYDWSKKEWINIGEREPVLFISTELTKEEVQDIILAHICGISQDKIEDWDMTEEEEMIYREAITVAHDSLLEVEYQSNFTIDSISDLIESHVLNNGIKYCFFDYINDSPQLYEYYYNATKTRLRTDQILFMFSCELKKLCNKHNIFLGSSTQLNDTYKDDANKDSSALKGSKAIIEKADGGILQLPVTHKDLKRLEPILNSGGKFDKVPNYAYYIFKNRGNKWKAIIVWVQLNLGTMRERDCFVTDYNFELISNIEQTILDFDTKDIGNISNINTVDIEDVDVIDLVNNLRNN